LSVIAALLVIVLPIEKVDPFQSEIQAPADPPIRHRERIRRLFEHYKALEAGKWAKVDGWGDQAEAEAILLKSIKRANKDRTKRENPEIGPEIRPRQSTPPRPMDANPCLTAQSGLSCGARNRERESYA